MRLEAAVGLKSWTSSSAEGRWVTLGPYYAMFPVSFVRDAVSRLCPTHGGVLDPFCGRGTAPFVAHVTNRPAIGVDVNPVGWVFSTTKIDPEPDLEKLIKRLKQIDRERRPEDTVPANTFQEWAWCPEVLSFLNSARRNLDWRQSRTDRTLAAIMLVHLHGKLGNAASNQMRQSKAMSPDYAVRWWSERNMRPPQIDPLTYFGSCVRWRYAKGTPSGMVASEIALGDARSCLPAFSGRNFKLLLTSPPYCGVTNYRLDNWIRLWLLGDSPFPNWETSKRFRHQAEYRKMIYEVFSASKKVMAEDAVILVRTDTRRFTRDVTAATLRSIWPSHSMFAKAEVAPWSQTSLFGQHGGKPGETDLLLVPGERRRAILEFTKVSPTEMTSEPAWSPGEQA